MSLILKRVLLAIICIALGLGGGYFMATELFKPDQWERGTLFSISVGTYAIAWMRGDKFLRDNHRSI